MTTHNKYPLSKTLTMIALRTLGFFIGALMLHPFMQRLEGVTTSGLSFALFGLGMVVACMAAPDVLRWVLCATTPSKGSLPTSPMGRSQLRSRTFNGKRLLEEGQEVTDSLPRLGPATSLHPTYRARLDALREQTQVEDRALAARPRASYHAHQLALYQKRSERWIFFAFGFLLLAALIEAFGGVGVLFWILMQTLVILPARWLVLPRLRRNHGTKEPVIPLMYSSGGHVGGNLATGNNDFAEHNVRYGLAGEVRTARMLDHFFQGISDITVFHSLHWPGSFRADIDHVVIIGSHVVLVDSKAWAPGDYRQIAPDIIIDENGKDRRSSMPNAIAKFREEQFRSISAVTVVHPASGEVTINGQKHTGNGSHIYLDDQNFIAHLIGLREQMARTNRVRHSHAYLTKQFNRKRTDYDRLAI